MFFPYLAVTLALILGGVGTISVEEYFNPPVLYYSLGLGVGITLCYILLNGHLGRREGYDIADYLAKIMLFFAAYLIMMVTVYYIEWYIDHGNIDHVSMQMQNNVSTMLLITMPFAFYHAKKSNFPVLWALFGVLQYAVMISTMSRSGILLGVIPLIIGLIY